MKTLTVIAALLFAVVANAQTHIYVPPPARTTPAPSYQYYNTINPATGQSQTGFVYTQPITPNSGFQQDTTSGKQSTYFTSGDTIVVIPLDSR